MAGLQASPAFANPVSNLVDQYNTNAVPAGGVDEVVVYAEERRKNELVNAVDKGFVSVGGVATATAAEAGSAIVRGAEAVAQVGGAAVAPPWFAAWVANDNNQMTALANQMTILQGQVYNVSVFHRNELAFRSLTDGPIQRPCKTIVGFGQAPLPDMIPAGGVPAAIAAVFAAPPPAPGILAVPPPALPFWEFLNAEPPTRAEIGYLAIFYNHTFGIVAGDNHQEQLSKLRFFLIGV
ncbi:hypothetical protein BDR26DRAFT_856744 [Obelidium mucronatum]|nr:hypothetical protein BDR26DRAFT_856744 [Obelidium mucronatum]